ncbi:hypothetical protein ATANTOWER_016002 [Ataeniobius toweri]|uniref:Uncharacterized protein n=1 Tax=Ataeniobius toweri TaxID=208326 RepID=A0ABU7A6L1_9TELE|nr:hypothetical protein [Ataeniobius toweri]
MAQRGRRHQHSFTTLQSRAEQPARFCSQREAAESEPPGRFSFSLRIKVRLFALVFKHETLKSDPPHPSVLLPHLTGSQTRRSTKLPQPERTLNAPQEARFSPEEQHRANE